MKVSSLILAIFGLTIAAGCAPPAAPVPAGADEQYQIALDSPAAAARSALLVLRAELRAHARKDRAAALAHLAALRERVAATDVMAAEIRKMPRAPQDDAVISALVQDLTGYWSAVVAAYADGFEFERMETQPTGEREALVIVPARGRESAARIRLRCNRTAEGVWHVSRIDFQPPLRATIVPASAPAGG